MKTRHLFATMIIITTLLTSCNLVNFTGVRVITPSDVNISENREVGSFNAIDFSTWGKINILQGDKESLNISGPDNLVPEIDTTVQNGTLIIKNRDNFTINPLNSQNPLIFTIVVKELTSLDISGAGDVQVEALSTPSLAIDLSGAGSITQNQLLTDSLSINLSGVGGINITGEAATATIDLSGVGSVDAPDLKIGTADVTVSGLGGATVWVTDQLNGKISGAGSISYYGNPQLQTSTSGVGSFKALGNK